MKHTAVDSEVELLSGFSTKITDIYASEREVETDFNDGRAFYIIWVAPRALCFASFRHPLAHTRALAQGTERN